MYFDSIQLTRIVIVIDVDKHFPVPLNFFNGVQVEYCC